MDDLLKNTIDKLETLSVAAAKVQAEPKLVRFDKLPDELVLVHAGTIERLPAPRPDRCHEFHSLSDLVDLARRIAASVDEKLPKEIVDSPSIWHEDNLVRVLFDDERRRDQASFVLTQTPQFQVLAGLAGKWFEQKPFLKLLKIDLRDCYDAPDLVPAVSQVKFATTTAGTGEVSMQRESMGRSIESEIKGLKDFREELVIRCDVWQNVPEVNSCIEVDCVLEIDPQKCQFAITPLPGEIRAHLDHLQGMLRKYLESQLTGFAIFRGIP